MTVDLREGATYHCVAGHPIPPEDLATRTAVWTLDRGARVRVCLEHGTPIALTVRPDVPAGEAAEL